MSREDYLRQQKRVAPSSARRTSSSAAGPARAGARSLSVTTYDRMQELEMDIACYEAEMKELDDTIRKATEARKAVQQSLEERIHERHALNHMAREGSTLTTTSRRDASRSTHNHIDYTKDFEWTAPMKARMKKVFGIDEFRLCQAG